MESVLLGNQDFTKFNTILTSQVTAYLFTVGLIFLKDISNLLTLASWIISLRFCDKKGNRTSYETQCRGTETCIKHRIQKLTYMVHSKPARTNFPCVTPITEFAVEYLFFL